jgi:hypothetical protein
MNKICRVCKVEKPLDEFGVNNNIKSGLNSMCKKGNLQVIPAKHNLAKNNHYWPDMPEVVNG